MCPLHPALCQQNLCAPVCLSLSLCMCVCLQLPSNPKRTTQLNNKLKPNRGTLSTSELYPLWSHQSWDLKLGCIMTLWQCTCAVLQNILMLAIMSLTAQYGCQRSGRIWTGKHCPPMEERRYGICRQSCSVLRVRAVYWCEFVLCVIVLKDKKLFDSLIIKIGRRRMFWTVVCYSSGFCCWLVTNSHSFL